MRNSIKIGRRKKVVVWLLTAIMLLEVCLGGTEVTAETGSDRSEISSSSFAKKQHWTISCEEAEITCEMTDYRTDQSLKLMMGLLKEDEINLSNALIRKTSYLSDHKTSITMDLSAVEEGSYNLLLMEQQTNGKPYYRLGAYKVTLKDSNVSFSDSTYGTQEKVFVENVSSTLAVDWYDAIPYTYYDSLDNLDTIIQKAAEITKDCKAESEMVEAIYNWIGNTVVYDMEAASCGNKNASDPSWVFENHRATCEGYAKLFQIMTTSLGIPCILVWGKAFLYNNTNASGHMWNLVYVDEIWEIVDTTWSTPNTYYGENNGNNVTGNLAYQNYIGISPMDFSYTHFSTDYLAVPGATRIEFAKEPSRTEFTIGEEFVFDGTMQMISTDEEVHSVNPDKIKIMGYNMYQKGEQEITVQYYNLNATYTITVTDAASEPSASPQPTQTTEPKVSPEPQPTSSMQPSLEPQPTPSMQPSTEPQPTPSMQPSTEPQPVPSKNPPTSVLPVIPGNYSKLPKPMGTVFMDAGGKAYYKVTEADYSGNSKVEYVEPCDGSSYFVTIPYSIRVDGVDYYVTSVAPGAFKNMDDLIKINMMYITKIGKRAFQGCTSLRTVKCPDVTYIEDYAFKDCKRLKKISEFFRIKKIGKGAFYNCKELKDITIYSKKVSKIGSKAFYHMNKNVEFSLEKKSYVKKCKKAAAPKTAKFYVNYELVE